MAEIQAARTRQSAWEKEQTGTFIHLGSLSSARALCEGHGPIQTQVPLQPEPEPNQRAHTSYVSAGLQETHTPTSWQEE